MGPTLCALVSLMLAPSTEAMKPTMVITWSDADGLARLSPGVRSEIESILGQAGVVVRFTDADRPDAHGVTVVVTPSEPSGNGWNLKPTAMGVYLASENASTVFVFYNRVVRVLGQSEGSLGLPKPAERRDRARAVARVAVHEIVHRLAPTLPHAELGLMQGRVGRRILTQGRATLDPASRAAVVAGLRRELQPVALVAERPNE